MLTDRPNQQSEEDEFLQLHHFLSLARDSVFLHIADHVPCLLSTSSSFCQFLCLSVILNRNRNTSSRALMGGPRLTTAGCSPLPFFPDHLGNQHSATRQLKKKDGREKKDSGEIWETELRQERRREERRERVHAFIRHLREAEEKLGLVHDQHFSSLQLKEAAALDLLKRMDDEHPHSSFLSNFDLDIEHPTRPGHHLGADPPAVIALRSCLRLDSTLLNSPLHTRKMKASPKCEHCGQLETIKHVILSCSQYDSARSDLCAALGFRPPDNYLMEICLGRTSDRKLKGRKYGAFERASASFLLEIDRLRPHL